MKTLNLLLCLVMLITSLPVVSQSKREMAFSGSSSTANKLLRTAWVAYCDAKMEEGNSRALQALNEDPNFGMAYASLALANAEGSEEKIRKAEGMQLSPDERLFIEGIKAGRDENLADEFFDPLLTKYPKDDYLHLLIMFINRNEGPAIEIGEKLIKRNPKFAPAYNLLGYGYMGLNDMAKAKAHFDKYISLRPDLANPYDSKGDYFMRTGKIEDAIRLYEKAVAMGMKQSAEKVERARAMIKYPKLSEEDAAIVKGIMVGRFEGMKTGDLDRLLENYSQQAAEIFDNQRVNIGLPNIMRRMSDLRRYGTHLKTNFEMGNIYGAGPIAIAYGRTDFTWKLLNTGAEEGQIRDAVFFFRKEKGSGWKILATHFYKPDDMQSLEAEEEKNISQLLHDWESALVIGEATTEKHLAALAKLYSEQAIEILPNELSNVGIANLRSRWQQFAGGKTERNALGSIGIEVFGRRAVAWGIADQHFYPKGSEELIKFQFPWAMILTKERDDVWRILALHWGAD